MFCVIALQKRIQLIHKPDLLLKREHSSVDDIQGPVSSRGDVEAWSELAPTAVAFCSAPKNINLASGVN